MIEMKKYLKKVIVLTILIGIIFSSHYSSFAATSQELEEEKLKLEERQVTIDIQIKILENGIKKGTAADKEGSERAIEGLKAEKNDNAKRLNDLKNKIPEQKSLEKYQEAQSQEALTKINPSDYYPGVLQTSNTFNERMGKILGAIRNFGIVSSVIILMIIGLKSMLGSINEKSEYKEKLPTFVIGVFILLACTIIPDIIFKVAVTFNMI